MRTRAALIRIKSSSEGGCLAQSGEVALCVLGCRVRHLLPSATDRKQKPGQVRQLTHVSALTAAQSDKFDNAGPGLSAAQSRAPAPADRVLIRIKTQGQFPSLSSLKRLRPPGPACASSKWLVRGLCAKVCCHESRRSCDTASQPTLVPDSLVKGARCWLHCQSLLLRGHEDVAGRRLRRPDVNRRLLRFRRVLSSVCSELGGGTTQLPALQLIKVSAGRSSERRIRIGVADYLMVARHLDTYQEPCAARGPCRAIPQLEDLIRIKNDSGNDVLAAQLLDVQNMCAYRPTRTRP